MQTCPELYVDALANSLKAINRRHDLPDEFTEWFTESLYPDPNDSLKILPWPKIQTIFQMPADKYFLSPDPWFHNLGYTVKVCNIQQSSYLLTVLQEAYEGVPYEVKLPDPHMQPAIGIDYDSQITLDLAPWVSSVRRSYAFALSEQGVTNITWSTAALEQLVYSFLSDNNEYLVDQYADIILQVLEHHSILEPVFIGCAPSKN